MKKLMTILGVFFCASILLVSCGSEDKSEDKVVVTPESEAKKMAEECFCSFSELSKKMDKSMGDEGEMEKLQKEGEELEEKCEKMGESLEAKYGTPDEPKDSDDAKKFWEAFEEDMKKCM